MLTISGAVVVVVVAAAGVAAGVVSLFFLKSVPAIFPPNLPAIPPREDSPAFSAAVCPAVSPAAVAAACPTSSLVGGAAPLDACCEPFALPHLGPPTLRPKVVFTGRPFISFSLVASSLHRPL